MLRCHADLPQPHCSHILTPWGAVGRVLGSTARRRDHDSEPESEPELELRQRTKRSSRKLEASSGRGRDGAPCPAFCSIALCRDWEASGFILELWNRIGTYPDRSNVRRT